MTDFISVQLAGEVIEIPILTVRWHDERTGCKRGHRYLAGELGGQDIAQQCPFFQGVDRCTMNGRVGGDGRNLCLFFEHEDSAGWMALRSWRLLEYPDGSTALCRAADAVAMAAELGATVVGGINLLPVEQTL